MLYGISLSDSTAIGLLIAMDWAMMDEELEPDHPTIHSMNSGGNEQD